jgi:hypothetical protein
MGKKHASQYANFGWLRGFLGYVGTFHSPKLGKFYMAAINKNELVKIVTYNGKIYVINYPHSLLEDRINE